MKIETNSNTVINKMHKASAVQEIEQEGVTNGELSNENVVDELPTPNWDGLHFDLNTIKTLCDQPESLASTTNLLTLFS